MMARPRLMPHQLCAVYSPYRHTAMLGGVGSGKSVALAHFVIRMITEQPDKTGLVGANSHDQLSGATLRELLYFLDLYGFDFVIDRRPPPAWGEIRRNFKTYKNLLSVRNRAGGITFIFLRVLSDGDSLRGITCQWYALDETRDTPRDTHDIVLSRMRERGDVRGLVTSTPNGFDWCYERFVKNGNDSSGLYGSMHVPTIAAVKCGVISNDYYQTMLRSYSPLVAQQELFAEHVNTREGRAYYAAGSWNKSELSPWGADVPTRDRGLIVGLDFNFNPAPMSWTFSQLGDFPNGETGCHTFSELCRTNIGTREMTRLMISMYPDFHYQIYGDASGQNRTTSNAGETDYLQLQEELNESGVSYSLDIDPGNPRVRDRVENVNRLCKNAIGETIYTYNPLDCPTLDRDFQQVQWKQNGKLDPGTDGLLTHASDALGYSLWKVLPFGTGSGEILSVARLGESIERELTST